ncbi:DUF5806 family protein [Methanogenium sp. MK-MG]|uniref:DUF5806 family protein n=1 Tax=Methanogenium sp. MK-MG TaxID=2599926 RepID=UPI0020B1445D|nr:DUF5806 family protein [Methanogenium sp. MK-MG]KAF1078598.1 hypothetical protein MKMG_00452 [Methanogenium sp. MK-MG]
MAAEGNFSKKEDGQNEPSEPKEGMLREEQHEPAVLTDNNKAIIAEKSDNQNTGNEITKGEQEEITEITETTPPEAINTSSKILNNSTAPPSDKSYSQIQEEVQAILGFNPELPALMPGRTPLSPEDEERINKYRKFQKVDGAAYRRVNQFLRKHTYITAREWAIARLCADFSTRGGAEMTFIGENLPDLVPFMTDTYSPQAVNQARSSFKRKVRKSGATFFYGALCGFFTADELDDILFESSEVARFLLEVEGTSIDLDDEIDIEDRITEVMREVAEAASMIRNRETAATDKETEKKEDTQTDGEHI